MYDVSIIGAGIVGSSIARELSKYKLRVCLIEKEEDVATGASKANSGIVHGGYVAKYGTLKGELCIKGNSMYSQLEKELNFGYRKPGALVIGFNEEDEKRIEDLYKNGLKVGCSDLEIIHGDKIKELEPNINKEVKIALYAKSVGVISPYEMTIALTENAIANGVDLKLETTVVGIEKKNKAFKINTNNGIIESKYVINAAGLYSDKIANMIGLYQFKILPKRGQYVLSTKDQGYLVNRVLFQVPTENGKGILVTTTYHGNFMIGPDAEQTDDREYIGTDKESIENIIEIARKSVPNFDVSKALTTFAGVRAVSSSGDFVIGESNVNGFINAAGIDSPGVTSSPAIAEKIVEIIKESGLELIINEKFNPYRKPIIVKKDKDFDGKIDDKDPKKNIICRCECVTEAEIIDAMHRGIKIKSTDAIKRRTRAGMGFCQGNFCRSRVKDIISRETNIPVEEVTVRGENEGKPPKRVNIDIIRNCNK
ncbi:NAD(P)/FAD-dependent oxidoreductase [Clostridium botulinum]|uniref:NAD(P)/FAD-dependent oxidoreductase n=1 Tax=Clostridium botulinum TaxID=1491 RepID=A0A0L9YCC6_CLOBO|nr:NAD(P)/FAD-dependent oxidoreductase [Clostridium botulinum]KAI3349770.1 NAD(P)/FAD-dependent oxidoreductase [Clostridium botulinum]KOM89477.1 FAD-dependent oxidoreductase [Clostridium botulinum]KOR61146.1 FAD-dependent oxidoreductase [Clostridium botulinum]MBN1041957.1 FAD/NAD(P)-binding oxidoreductase [Clostridium botulinum]MBN1048605.1 FAD/NAD(P)-binding oxidoreductase [Clostridium botulinum]